MSKGGQKVAFYSLPEYRKWMEETPNSHTWTVKYYKGRGRIFLNFNIQSQKIYLLISLSKGLGTSTTIEAREYFSNIRRNRIPFKYSGAPCDDKIELAFAKKRIDDRKLWLNDYMSDLARRRAENEDEGSVSLNFKRLFT